MKRMLCGFSGILLWMAAPAAFPLASANGNYPYYVLRRDGDQLTLLGMMFGDGYATSRIHGHLQFTMHFREAAGQLRPMRFQVRGKALLNLTPLGGRTTPYIAGI
jgi:hypothetical protein